MSAQPRKKSGQFRSETPRDPLALYELVRVVAVRAADLVNAAAGAGVIPVLPRLVTMAAFDDAAAALEAEGGYGTIPRARGICKLLPDRDGKPFSWPALLELVFDERNVERGHMERRSAVDDPFIAEPHIYYALNRIARMRKARTLSGIEYSATRELLVRADQRRPNGGRLARLLPTFGQIQGFVRDRYLPSLQENDASGDPATEVEDGGIAHAALWARALEIAELDPPPEQPQVVRGRISYIDAAVRFYEVVKRLPSEPKLKAFARDFNFAVEDTKRRSWPEEVLPKVIEEIRRRGLPEPPAYDSRRERLTWEVPEVSPWPDDPPYRPKTFYSHAMVLTVVAEFRDWLPRGQAPSTSLYQQFAADNPDKPSLQVIQNHGTLDRLLEELASPRALEEAYRKLNPTAAELAELESERLEKKLRHPTPQGILRVITERGEVGSREISEELGAAQGTVAEWVSFLIRAGKIETTTPSRVAKNVKYCLRGNAPTPAESKLRKLRKQVEGQRCQAVLKLIRERDKVTMLELSEELGNRPEVVAKWVRPLKALNLVEQVDEGVGGKRRTYYRPSPQSGSGAGALEWLS